jgi:hypothetical protein
MEFQPPQPLWPIDLAAEAAPNIHDDFIPFTPSSTNMEASSSPRPQRRIRLRQPDWLSWAGIIDHFSPGAKARDTVLPLHNSPEAIAAMWNMKLENVAASVPDAARLVRDEARYGLTTLSVKSCGYVIIDAPHINSMAVVPRDLKSWRYNPMRDSRGLSGYMQTCQDGHLGYITPFACPFEKDYLEFGYGMQYGWNGIYDERTKAEALADGYHYGGVGRFSGLIEAGANAR